jgi:hypothetical protein
MNAFRRLAVLTLIFATTVFAATSAFAQSDAQKALDHFKSLVGTWEGKSASGDTEEVTYTLAAGGTAVMADMHLLSDSMMSMFYVDGGHLMMTHFCPSNNQPRMQATISPDLKTVTFDFLDATNLAGPQAGHMHRAVYLFTDAGHYSEEWTWKKEGKDSKFQYQLERKK